jgi:ComF family protein
MFLSTIKEYLWDFVGLFYPRLCLACGYNLPPGDNRICVRCEFHMVKTNFHLTQQNDFTNRFVGRVPLHTAASLYFFIKDTPIQRLLHQLKYSDKPDIGVDIGKIYGEILAESPFYADVDCIVPVPLHPRKKHKRGYNQSERFAAGLSETMNKPCLPDGLKKVELNESQTRKNRMQRAENTQDMYEANQPELLKNKHILLVDDVMTTGATLEACALPLLELPNVKISIVTIAIGKR